MKRQFLSYLFTLVLALSFCFICKNSFSQNTGKTASKNIERKKTKVKLEDMDADLEGYPDYYRIRVMKFRKMIRAQKTKPAKIKKAISILDDKTSPYRQDALRFLADVKAKEAVVHIMKAGEDKELRADAAYAIGEIKQKNGIEFLLRCLYDTNANVRSVASLSLRKITQLQFGYLYTEPEDQRNKAALLWENWWTKNHETFQVTQINEEDRKDADEKWNRYGKRYIERILNE